MPNWTAIDLTAVKTGKNTLLLTSVQDLATSRGEADPSAEMIADVTARIRAAISTGNQLDLDATKIPNSLKGLALRMITLRLKDYLDVDLTALEGKQADEDRSYLNRINDDKLRFETPDAPAGNAEMQAGAALDTITSTNRHRYTRHGLEGLL